MKLHIILFLTALASLCTALAQPTRQEEDLYLNKFLNRDLKEIKKFYFVGLTLAGSAKKIGLDEKQLDEFVKLRFRNLFTGFTIETLPMDKNGLPAADINEREWAYLWVSVWTVGEDYPVAQHIEIKLGKAHGGGFGYVNAKLGFSSAKAIREERLIRDSISDLMEEAATTLFKAQGKL